MFTIVDLPFCCRDVKEVDSTLEGIVNSVTCKACTNSNPDEDQSTLNETRLTLDKPVFRSLFIRIQNSFAFHQMIWSLVQHTILETLTQNAQNFIVDHFVTTELLVRFEVTNWVVRVTLINCRNTTEFLMIPWIVLLIWFDDFFCLKDKLNKFLLRCTVQPDYCIGRDMRLRLSNLCNNVLII